MKNKEIPLRFRVIGIGQAGGVLSQLDSLLADGKGELYLVPRAQSAVEMLRTLGPVDLMLVEFPLADTPLEEVFHELYRELAQPPRVAVLCADSDGALLPDLSEWNSVVLSFDRSLEELAAALQRLLHRAPRVPARLMVRLEVAAAADRLLRLAQTENISKSGMLLRTNEEFPENASVRFELSFPGDADPIRGEARVVRRVESDQESLRGVGVEFQSLMISDQVRLERFLERAGESEPFPAVAERPPAPPALAGGR